LLLASQQPLEIVAVTEYLLPASAAEATTSSANKAHNKRPAAGFLKICAKFLTSILLKVSFLLRNKQAASPSPYGLELTASESFGQPKRNLIS
jgi:hypothetical protein